MMMVAHWRLCGVMLAVLLGAMGCAGALAARAQVELSARGSAVGETALGDVAADAMRASAKAEVALLPAFWLREVTLPPGEVPPEAARAALAFPDDEIVVLALRGDRLAETLERGLALVPRTNKGFLQVAGLSVKFDRRLPPERRITEVMVDKRRLEPGRTYKVALPLPLARGALGYFRVFNGAPLTPTGVTLSEALARALAGRGAISVKVGERLRDAGAPPAGKP